MLRNARQLLASTDTYYKEEEFLSQTTIEELIKTLIDVCYESGIDVIEVLETYK